MSAVRSGQLRRVGVTDHEPKEIHGAFYTVIGKIRDPKALMGTASNPWDKDTMWEVFIRGQTVIWYESTIKEDELVQEAPHEV